MATGRRWTSTSRGRAEADRRREAGRGPEPPAATGRWACPERSRWSSICGPAQATRASTSASSPSPTSGWRREPAASIFNCPPRAVPWPGSGWGRRAFGSPCLRVPRRASELARDWRPFGWTPTASPGSATSTCRRASSPRRTAWSSTSTPARPTSPCPDLRNRAPLAGVESYRTPGPSVEDRPLEDHELVERARRGDVHAYEELVRRYQRLALRTAAVITGRDDAPDAAQEAFVKAYRSLDRFREGAAFRPWLLRIVANEAINRVRSNRRSAAL
ncbi:MAG TPA: hypothetical protein DIT48_06580, partial [Actinobacteria bacterium]|nr:hypothetical protein [Actinomycetota bacterium]